MRNSPVKRKIENAVAGFACFLGSCCATGLLLLMMVFIARESWPLWSAQGVVNIVAGTDWSPLATPPRLGLLTMILSTFWVALGSLILAAPLGLCGAVFLAEFAPGWLAGAIRPVLNILTGIPSVVYGFVGATVLVKWFEVTFNMASGESLFCASLVLTVMVLPYIVAASESALRAVPGEYRRAALALGASRQYMVLRVLLPLAGKGLMGALILAFGRAAGETMAVLMLAGNTLILPVSWFSKGEPLPALIALELGTSEVDSPHYQALFAAGLLLLAFVFSINLVLTILRKGVQSGVRER